MSEFQTEIKTITARSEHYCWAYEIICDTGYGEPDFTKDEWDAIKKMKESGGKIKNGESCYFWSGKFDGEMYSAWANVELFEIVFKYGWNQI